MGDTRVHPFMTPNLSLDHINKLDFILDEIGRDNKMFNSGFNAIHMSEARFYLIHAKQEQASGVGSRERRRWACSIEVQHQRPIPKMMFICVVSRSEPARNFVGKIGIWQESAMKEAPTTTVRHGKVEKHAADVTI